MSEQLTCPNPECFTRLAPIVVGNDGSPHWVSCSCGVSGPEKTSKAEAVAAWKRITFKEAKEQGE